MFGKACPTVSVLTVRLSSTALIVQPGAASVCPYTLTISRMFMSAAAIRMSSGGQFDPAMMPVRIEEKSVAGKSGCWRIAMNIVGTPLKQVIFSRMTQASEDFGLK